TSAGTNPVAPAAHVYAIGSYAELNGVVYFNGESSIPGDELWRTDGTAQGTWLVKKVLPGDYRSPSWLDLTALQGALCFVAAGPPLVNGRSDATERRAAGGRSFFTGSPPETGRELCTSDGTPDGTVPVKETIPGPRSGEPTALMAAGGLIYFRAADPSAGLEL